MTPFLWLLAACGLAFLGLSAAAILWSVWVLVSGRGTTTSMFVSSLPRGWVLAMGLAVGFAVGFVAGHWFWPIHLPGGGP